MSIKNYRSSEIGDSLIVTNPIHFLRRVFGSVFEVRILNSRALEYFKRSLVYRKDHTFKIYFYLKTWKKTTIKLFVLTLGASETLASNLK